MELISNFISTFGGVIGVVAAIIAVCVVFSMLGVTFIPNNKVGIVEKKFSTKKKSGGIISTNGESGFESKVLRGGWYFKFRLIYKVHKVDLIVIPAGEIGYVYARDGKNLPAGQILGYSIKDAACFENVDRFFEEGGEKGPQALILNSGTYAINLAQFVILTKGGVKTMPLDIAGEKEIIEGMDERIRNATGGCVSHPTTDDDDEEYDMRGHRHIKKEVEPTAVHETTSCGYNPVIISENDCGIVTVHDGPALEHGELLAKPVEGHNGYQIPWAYISAGGTKGIQVDPITNGTYYINRLFATVEIRRKVEIPIGMVGVVNYFTGEEGEDLSGETYSHGELVENGSKGVWVKPLEPNKYAWNPYAGRIYKVPTTNFVLRWQSNSSNALDYDEKLSEVTLITKDAFQPDLPLSVVIHIDYKDAPKVIQRFGDIKTLISETIDPMVGAYFKNIGQTKTLLELIQNRSEIQANAMEEMRSKFATYNLNLVEVLIGTPKSSQTDKKIDKIYDTLQERQMAKEQAITLAEQTKTAVQEREFKKAEEAAAMQSDLTKSEMQISIKDNNGKAEVAAATQHALVVEQESIANKTRRQYDADAELYTKQQQADGDAVMITKKAEAEAAGIKMVGVAEADVEARKGVASGIKTREQVDAIGSHNYATYLTAGVIAEALAKFQGQIVPNSVITMGNGEQGSNVENLFTLLFTKILNGDIQVPGMTVPESQDESEDAKRARSKIRESLYDAMNHDNDDNAEEEISENDAVINAVEVSDNNVTTE